jgi:hypothetical protein
MGVQSQTAGLDGMLVTCTFWIEGGDPKMRRSGAVSSVLLHATAATARQTTPAAAMFRPTISF